MKKLITILHACIMVFLSGNLNAQEGFDNFKVSIYTRAQEVKKMEDPDWLDSTWAKISANIHVDKIYLETHRDRLFVDEKTLKKAIRFFEDQGLKVAGGITYTVNEGNYFQTFCYTNPEHRKKAQEIIEFTASHFDEVILDDFFFTSCKCELCCEAKGNRSWSDYRLELMTDAAKNVILGPAKKVNPDVKVVIKYPNWYDHFQECGFNLETQPVMFDGLYTGTETRDAVMSDQHLQPYLGYLIFRYFENLKPGKNGGGWVDTYASRNFDRYAEQLWLTILAKAPEMTLFEYSAMASPPWGDMIPVWKDQATSFRYQEFLPLGEHETMGKAAAHALDIIDDIAGKLGNPFGIKSYKPYHSGGEDFLQNFLGMIGIPLDLVPEFPMADEMIILTEQAAQDPEIVGKIEQRLRTGKDVFITSGLLRALQDRGIKNLVNLEFTSRKAVVKDFKIGRFTLVEGEKPVMIPVIEYFTNDSWEVISGMDNGFGWPLLHRGAYGGADLYVLTIPDNFNDLYSLPPKVLNRIREVLCGSLGLWIEGPSEVALFLYDNSTLVVESFRDEITEVKIVMKEKKNFLVNPVSGEKIEVTVIPEQSFRGRVYSPEMYQYYVTLPPHSFGIFKTDP